MCNTCIQHGNWKVQANIYPLFKFVLPMFEGIFGQAIMCKEQCSVYVDMDCSTAPITAFNPTRIILKAEPCYWCQVIRQLAHELTHYVVRQKTNYQYNNCAVAAFEEPACEAMAMYILKLCSKQWSTCDYYQRDTNWGINFENYRRDIYNNACGSARCGTYTEWTSICEGFTGGLTSDSQRPIVSSMRNYLYDSFVQMPEEISSFIEYPLYLRSIPYDKLIDTDKWEIDRPNASAFIKTICAIMPAVV